MNEQKLPPVTQIAMASLALIVAGGIYLSAHIPQHVPLAPAVVLLALSAAADDRQHRLVRARDGASAWDRFFDVAQAGLCSRTASSPG